MEPASIHHSERLAFEPLVEAHVPGLAEALCDPAVYAFIDMECPTPADLSEAVRTAEAGPQGDRAERGEVWLDFAVRRKADSRLIGRLEATIIGCNAEAAYLFGPRYWGQGYGRESLAWLHGLLRQQFQVSGCWATINPENSRSLRLIQVSGYAEAPEADWPCLTSYDAGDLVFRKQLDEHVASPASKN